MSNQPDENTLQLVNAHIDVLDDTAVQHTRWNVPTTAFFLEFAETPQDDAFAVRQSISNVWDVTARITVMHA